MGRLLFFDSRTGVLLTEGYFAFKRRFYLFASDFFFFFFAHSFSVAGFCFRSIYAVYQACFCNKWPNFMKVILAQLQPTCVTCLFEMLSLESCYHSRRRLSNHRQVNGSTDGALVWMHSWFRLKKKTFCLYIKIEKVVYFCTACRHTRCVSSLGYAFVKHETCVFMWNALIWNFSLRVSGCYWVIECLIPSKTASCCPLLR